MEKESIDMEIEKYMKEVMSLTKERDEVSINGPIALHMRENGSMINNMDLVV